MKRENRKDFSSDGLDFKKVLYITGSILAVAVIGFVITFFVYGNTLNDTVDLGRLNSDVLENALDDLEQTSSQFGKTVNEMESEEQSENTNEEADVTKYAVNTSQTESKVVSQREKETKKENTTKTTTETKKEEVKVEDPKFQMPVTGEIIKEFAKDKLIYSNTLSEWVTHNGVDIRAEKTTVVKASAEGTVKSIKNDPRYGLTVVVEHVNGFTSVYANLLTAEFVVEGEKISQGQTIGTVGNTATFEIADEAHLHFEITKDGEYLDPELYIKK